MKLAVVSVAVLGCSGHATVSPDAHGPWFDGSSEVCTPFVVTGPGGTSYARPVWTGSEWAIGRPGIYVRIDETGTLTTMPLPDLGDEPLAWDGIELGYYVPAPQPHIALFTPGDVGTVHAGPSFAISEPSPTADVAPGASTAQISAFFSGPPMINSTGYLGWSTGAISSIGDVSLGAALAQAPNGSALVYTRFTGGPGPGSQYGTFASISGAEVTLVYHQQGEPMRPIDVAGDGRVVIVQQADQSWKIVDGVPTSIPRMPPLAWNGDVFITAAAGNVVTYDTSVQPVGMRPGAVPSGTVIGAAATKRRALFVVNNGSSDVQFVQICL